MSELPATPQTLDLARGVPVGPVPVGPPQFATDAAFGELRGGSAMTLAALLASAWRRRLAFLAAAALTFLAAAAIILSLKPRYESEALLMVDPRPTNITNMQAIQDGPATLSDLNFVRSQMQILTSDELVRDVVEDLRLQDDPGFAAPASPLASLLRRLGLDGRGAGLPAHPIEEAIAQYKTRLGAFSDGKSFIISASFTAADPAFAQRVLQRHLALFQAGQIVAKRQTIATAEKWFESELQTLQAKLLAAEARQQAFRRDSQLIRAGGETIPARQLTSITNQLTDARADLDRKEARFRELSGAAAGGTAGGPDTAMLASDLVQKLREQEASAAQQVAQQRQFAGGPNYPPMAAARAALADVQGRIARELQRLTASAASDVEIARAHTRQLETALAEVNARLAATSNDELTAAQLDRDIDADRRLYDELLLRSKQVSIQGQLQEPDIHVVSAPTLALTPSFPRHGMLLSVALMAAVVVGAMVAFVTDLLQAGRATALHEIEAACGLPGLAIIPKLPQAGLRGPLHPAAALPKPGTQLAAALQIMRNSIGFRCAGHPAKVIVFASALPGEGKTVLATLYARSLATASRATASRATASRAGKGRRVLLIDADLRRFGLTRSLGLAGSGDQIPGDQTAGKQSAAGQGGAEQSGAEQSGAEQSGGEQSGAEQGGAVPAAAAADAPTGLAACLSGRPLEACVVADLVDGLDILPAGLVQADPGTLLAAERVRDLLAAAAARYAAVVIDTPPITVVDDALHLVAQADATVLVARWNRTRLSAIQNARHRLGLTGGQVAGVVLTGVDVRAYGAGSPHSPGLVKQRSYYIAES